MIFSKSNPMKVKIKGTDVEYDELLYFLINDAKKVMTKSPSLREETDLKKQNKHIVISVPSFFNHNQMNIIKSIGDLVFDGETESKLRPIISPMKEKRTKLYTLYTFEAIAYTYGYENNSKFNSLPPTYRLFIDMGYSCCTCFLAKYTKDKCTIESCYYDESIGGKYIDIWLYKCLEEKIKKQLPHIDLNNVKFKIAIKNELIKCKEKLSASGASEVAVRIELGDDDFDGTFSVKDIEDILIKGKRFNEKIINLTEKVTKEPLSKLDFQIVVVGGSMRIPCIQREVLNYWKRKDNRITSLTYTLNMDEAVACGCICNILFYLLKVTYNFTTACSANNINQSNKFQEDNNCRNKQYYDNLKKFYMNIENDNNLVIEGSKMQNDYEALLYNYQHMIEEIGVDKYNVEYNYLLEEIKKVHDKSNEDPLTYFHTKIEHLKQYLKKFLIFYKNEKDKAIQELNRAVKANEDKMINNLSKIYNPYIENSENYSIQQIKQALKDLHGNRKENTNKSNATTTTNSNSNSNVHFFKQEDLVDNTVVMGRTNEYNISSQYGNNNSIYHTSHHKSHHEDDSNYNSSHQQQQKQNQRQLQRQTPPPPQHQRTRGVNEESKTYFINKQDPLKPVQPLKKSGKDVYKDAPPKGIINW